MVRKRQIKGTVRYHFVPNRLATFPKYDNVKFWQGSQEKLIYCCRVTIWHALVNMKMCFPRDRNAFLVTHGTLVRRMTWCAPGSIYKMFMEALSLTAKPQKQAKCPVTGESTRVLIHLYHVTLYSSENKPTTAINIWWFSFRKVYWVI